MVEAKPVTARPAVTDAQAPARAKRAPRGGASKAEVIIGDGEIDYPKVIGADVLVAMSQEACDKYFASVKKGGMLIVDEERVGRVPTTRAVKATITRLAAEATGRVITANVVALGLLIGLSGVVSRAAIEKAVTARAPQGTEEMNRAALSAGFAAAERWLAGRPPE